MSPPGAPSPRGEPEGWGAEGTGSNGSRIGMVWSARSDGGKRERGAAR